MSLAVRIAKRRYAGDPGLFSFIGSAIGTVAKGALGLATGGIPGLIGAVAPTLFPPAPGKTTAPPSPAGLLPLSATGQAMPGTGVQVQFPNLGGLGGGGINIGTFTGGGQTGTAMVPAGVKPGTCVAPGFRTNKSHYYTRGGEVMPGTKCVRTRRMNPLNPRAASRAMARLVSAKRAAKFLGRITIRSGKGCGCK